MKKNIRKILAVLLVCVMIFALAACNGGKENSGGGSTGGGTTDNSGGGSGGGGNSGGGGGTSSGSGSTAPGKDTLTVAITSDTGTLDPQFNIGSDLQAVLRMIYEPLWEWDVDFNRTWVLATGCDIISPTVWRIYLREGVTFANGNPFNADDVLFTFWRANNRPGATPLLQDVNVELSKKIDDYTIEIVFDQFRIDAEYGTIGTIGMFDKESFSEDTVSTVTNGTGPYKLNEHIIDSHVSLSSRGSDYWGTPAIIDNLFFRVLKEDAQKVNALETGTVDMSKVPFQDIQYVETLKELELSLRFSGWSRVIYYNLDPHSPFANNDDARRAVSYAIDRDAVINVAYSGYASMSKLAVADGKPDMEDRFANIGIYGTGQDLVKARQLAESSGLTEVDILFINNGDSAASVTAELVQEDLRQIGVTANIWTLDSGSWLGVIFDATAWDMAVDFTLGTSVAYAYGMWARMQAGGTYMTEPWAGSEKFLEDLEYVSSEPDASKRSNALYEMAQIMADGLIWYSLCDMYEATAYNKDIIGYHVMNSGYPNFALLSW